MRQKESEKLAEIYQFVLRDHGFITYYVDEDLGMSTNNKLQKTAWTYSWKIYACLDNDKYLFFALWFMTIFLFKHNKHSFIKIHIYLIRTTKKTDSALNCKTFLLLNLITLKSILFCFVKINRNTNNKPGYFTGRLQKFLEFCVLNPQRTIKLFNQQQTNK